MIVRDSGFECSGGYARKRIHAEGQFDNAASAQLARFATDPPFPPLTID
jgi:hypothetical protein